ncbi:MAG: DCC1-like thiol-disulfide oxidoreductase family protein [Acidobacteriota bacterium]|nr:DCC1-like thiol-disulfide oxidoreductase family protein [Acidobacteriota bacterium]
MTNKTVENDDSVSCHVIYDGACGLCARAVTVLRLLDTRRVLVAHDARDRVSVVHRFPVLEEGDLDDAMFVVSPDGRVHRGFFAFRRLLWTSPWLWLLLPVLYLPGAGVVGVRVYAWIARDR